MACTHNVSKLWVESREQTILQDVKVGAKVQGIVTGFTSYGCFVRFFGDVKGLIHTSGLGLGPGKTPADAYEIGQVWSALPSWSTITAKQCRALFQDRKISNELHQSSALKFEIWSMLLFET